MTKAHRIITLLTILVALFVVNLLAARHPLRLDLTEGRVYTLSDATEKILAGLTDVLTVRVYFSGDLPPQLEALSRDVDDLLAEFRGAGHGRISIEHIDPSESTAEEQKVGLLGIPPVQVNVINRDRQEVAKVFLGIAVLYAGKQQVIPVVADTTNLEYQLAEAILMVTSAELPRIAWYEGDIPERQGESAFAIIRQALERRYQLQPIAEGAAPELDPASVKAVVIASPRILSEELIAALKGYIAAGGSVIALLDRYDVGAQLNLVPVEGNAFDFFAGYGAKVEALLVTDAANSMAAFTGGVITYHLPYPLWPEVRAAGLNRDEPITAGLQSAVFPWTSPVLLTGPGEAIAVSSDEANASAWKTDQPLSPQLAETALKQEGQRRQVLAAMVPGIGSGRIFVAGSSRWVMDRFLPQFPQNAALFQNTVDALAMGDALIGIRSREVASRPIALIPDEVKAWLRYANVAAGPLMLGLIGLSVVWMRRLRRRSLIARYGNEAI